MLWILWPKAQGPKTADFEVYEMPKQTSQAVNLTEKPKAAPKVDSRAVFGQSKKAITSDTPSKDAVEVKKGNTVAIAPDNKQLKDDDAESLPIPADEFLVNEMPSLLSDVRIPYPPEAKKAGIQGPVVMDLLIDQNGKVRDVKLISGPGYGLNEAATEAAKSFQFKPGKVEDRTVAVRIRYSYRFVLER